MLAQEQAVVFLQGHVEGIFAGGGHLIAAAAVVIHIVVILDHGVVVDGRYGAGPPGRVVCPGDDGHRSALVDALPVHLVQGPLDAQVSGLRDHDIGQRVAVVVRAVFFVDGGDVAGHRGLDAGIQQSGVLPLELRLFDGDIVLRLFDLHLQRLDLQGIGQLIGRGGVLCLLFQIGDLALTGLNGVLHALDFKLRLLNGELHGLRVVGKQNVALVDRLAHLDFQLRHGHIAVKLDLRRVSGHNHTGKPVVEAHVAVADDRGHRLHGNGVAAFTAAAGQHAKSQNRRQTKRRGPLYKCDVHSCPP